MAGRPEYELRAHAVVGDLAIPLDQWCDGHEEGSSP